MKLVEKTSQISTNDTNNPTENTKPKWQYKKKDTTIGISSLC
jgi:hypothetical protein